MAILDDYQGVALTGRLAEPPSARADPGLHRSLDDLDALAKRLHAFDAVVAMRERTPFPRALFERLPNCGSLITAGMRNAAIDSRRPASAASGLRHRQLPHPTAELTWGLILALARHIPREDRAMREGGWQTTLGTGLEGKTLGLLGLGRLGGAGRARSARPSA